MQCMDCVVFLVYMVHHGVCGVCIGTGRHEYTSSSALSNYADEQKEQEENLKIQVYMQ